MPHPKPERTALIEATGQNGIPSLVNDEDGTVIPDDDDKIIEYLADKFRVKSQESRVKGDEEAEACPVPWANK